MSLLNWLLLGGVGYIGYKMVTGGAATTIAQAATGDISAFVQEATRRLDPALSWTVYTSTNYVGVTGTGVGSVTQKFTFTSLPAAWAWLMTLPVRTTFANVTMAAL